MLLRGVGPGVIAALGLAGCDGAARELDPDAAPLDGHSHGDDGAPIRQACVIPDGTVLSAGTFGRLDGIIVAVAPPGAADRACQPDAERLHLQILANGQVYDIAINVGDDVHSQTFDRALFDPAWNEGWHSGVFVEYTGLGLHSTTIPLPAPGALVEAMLADLATANHVSVYATGYGPEGAHLVHRNSQGRDGLLVTHPLRAPAHARAFSFSDQVF